MTNLPAATGGGELYDNAIDEEAEGNQLPADLMVAMEEARTKDPQALLEDLHKEMLVQLWVKLKAGVISHQEMAILRNMLRDNGLTVPIKPTIPGIATEIRRGPLVEDLPTFDDPDYEE